MVLDENSIGDALTMRPGDVGSLGRIDQYTLVRELGGGGFGTVYLAMDVVSGVEYAVKGLPPMVRNSGEEMENVRANFALVSRLSHTNIARAHVLHPAKEVVYFDPSVRAKLRVDPGDTLMVMEYAPGVTLSRWRKQFPDGKVPLKQALEIVRQVATAIDYAHDERILHRDIKPANVMVETKVNGALVARVLDFGLAAEIRSSMGRVSREIHDTSGTRPYMAPEQWVGRKQGPATDQYALAVMLYELLTGEVPFASLFDTGDPVLMMTVVTTRAPEIPAVLPEPVRRALARALAKKPEERFPSCAAFTDSLGGPQFAATAAEQSRSRVTLSLLIAAALALAAIGGWWYYRQEQVREQARIATEVERQKAAAKEAKRKAEEEARHKAAAEEAKRKAEEEARQKAAAEEAKRKAEEEARQRAAAEEAKRNADPANAIMRLLNSQASGSGRSFAQAAEVVAAEAKKGNLVCAYMLAVVSRMPNPPPAARLDEATRKKYLDGYRDKIEKLANEKNNSMAWYLLSLENNDRDLLHRAADAGNVQAMNAWGSYLVTRAVGGTSDTNEVNRILGVAYNFFKNAADKGDANGLYNLGMCHLRGLGTPQDDQSAFNCFRSAAEKEHPEAINNMGLFFREGRVVEKNLVKSARFFEKAASYDNAYGQFNFALALQNGNGVAKDEARAAALLSKAAAGGCVEAVDAYGVALWKGRGVREDHEAAARQFLRASEAGYPPAMENLSTCYRLGKGVEADERRSLEWKIRARAARGDSNARAWLQQNANKK